MPLVEIWDSLMLYEQTTPGMLRVIARDTAQSPGAVIACILQGEFLCILESTARPVPGGGNWSWSVNRYMPDPRIKFLVGMFSLELTCDETFSSYEAAYANCLQALAITNKIQPPKAPTIPDDTPVVVCEDV